MRFALSVDDFGTGYASLARLVRSPFQPVQASSCSFVSGVEPDTPRWFVVESTVALAQKLGLDTVAEGVETAAEMQLLKDAGCDCVQGYWLAALVRRRPCAHVPG